MSVRPLKLDLDVDAGREVEPHERVDGLRRRVDDVDQPLVRAHLEVLPRVLVLVRRADDAVHVLFRRQRHRASDLRAGPRHGLDDLASRAVDDLVVIGLEPNADLLSRHGGLFVLRFSVRRGWYRLPGPYPHQGRPVRLYSPEKPLQGFPLRCITATEPDDVVHGVAAGPARRPDRHIRSCYLMILATRPAPTVRPPSRMANFRPSSIATGWISWTAIPVLSPGMTISVPSGRVTTPVTSVVRK